MRCKFLICCFGKEGSEAELKAAVYTLKPEFGSQVCEAAGFNAPVQKPQQVGQCLHLRVLEGKQKDQEVTLCSTATPESLPKKARFGTSAEASFRLEAEEGVGEMHFQAYFSPEHSLFCIGNLGGGSGTFIQLDFPLEIEDGLGLSFGYHNYLEFSMLPTSALRVQFLEGEKAAQSFTYTPNDSPIVMGRMKDCSLKFDDTGLSRYQCTVVFEESRWWVKDGSGTKGSTNGTWVYVRETFVLRRVQTIIKVGAVMISAKIAPCPVL